jgi:molybdenum cofactor cytidylyltransferase
MLPDSIDSACFLLADMPAVGVELVHALLDRHRQTLASITAPVFEGRQGNPVLFDRRTFSDLSELSGQEGGRMLFHSCGVEQVPWDHSILTDIDTAEDFRHLNR